MPIRPENVRRYPPDWPAVSAAIRERAGGRCECNGECGRSVHRGRRCSERHGATPETFGGARVVLTVAHLDHVPEHVDPGNLRAYCQACHLAYDAAEHADARARNAARDYRARLEAAGQIRLF